MMKKKILIGSVFAALIMLSLPFISTVNAQSQEENNLGNYDENLSSPGYVLALYGDEADNPGGWVTNTINYVSIIFNDIQYIVSSRGICQDLFNTLKDTFSLIKNLRECNNFVELISVVINEFIPTVQEIISVAQRVMGLVQVVTDLIQTTQEFIPYIQGEPWTAPVLIRGTVSGSEGTLEAHITCNEASQDTGGDGYYNIEVAALQDYLPSSYSVTASSEGYTDETSSTGLIFPDAVITVDFELDNEDDEAEPETISKNTFLISKYFGSRFSHIFSLFFFIFNKA